jgi:hypothetical protein
MGYLLAIAVLLLIVWSDASEVLEARRTGVVHSRGAPVSRSDSPEAYAVTYLWRLMHLAVGVAMLLAFVGLEWRSQLATAWRFARSLTDLVR